MVMPARCDECGGTFDPLRGGICPACRRLLCPRHRSGWRGLLGVPASPDEPCPACRDAGRTAARRDR